MAKTNYLLAIAPLLRARSEIVAIPVYMSDSLRSPQQTMIKGVKAYEEVVNERTSLYVPLHEDAAVINEMVDAMRHYAADFAKYPETKPSMVPYLEGLPKLSSMLNKGEISQSILSILQHTAQALTKLIKDPKHGDTIWGFVLKDFYKPALLVHSFDVVVGVSPVPPITF